MLFILQMTARAFSMICQSIYILILYLHHLSLEYSFRGRVIGTALYVYHFTDQHFHLDKR